MTHSSPKILPEPPLLEEGGSGPGQTLEGLRGALQSLRLDVAGLDEVEIQDRTFLHLVAKGVPCRREFRFAPRCRADIWVEGGIVVELKKQRPPYNKVYEQVLRYARTGVVKGIILLLERHVPLPRELEGIPVSVLSLNSLWGIAL